MLKYDRNSPIVPVARAARQEMERFAKSNSFIGDPTDLCCYCAISSYFFKMVALRVGIKKITLVEGQAFNSAIWDYYEILEQGDQPDVLGADHCWVEHDGFVFDITATQFRETAKVFVVKVGSSEYRKLFWPLHTNNSAVREMKLRWPNEQSPFTYMTDLRKRADKLTTKLIQKGVI